MTKKQKNISIILTVLLFVVLLFGHPWFYFADSINLRVVDADTKEPIEGVIITANWQLIYSTPAGAVQGGQLQVMESVTDKQGSAYFPSWGPRFALSGRLGHRRPQLLMFKPGYKTAGFQNTAGARITKNIFIGSEWDGRTVELKKFKGSLAEYGEHVYNLGSDIDFMLDFARGDKDCNWKNVPQMLAALHKKSLQIDNKGIKLKGWRLGQHILQIQDIPQNSGCGSPNEFLANYLTE